MKRGQRTGSPEIPPERPPVPGEVRSLGRWVFPPEEVCQGPHILGMFYDSRGRPFECWVGPECCHILAAETHQERR
jgi:hypothetical protein